MGDLFSAPILLILILLSGFFLIYLFRNSDKTISPDLTEKYAETKAESLAQTEKIHLLSEQITQETQEKNQLLGTHKSLEKSHRELKYYTENLEKNHREILQKNSLLESRKVTLEKNTEEKILQLEHARTELEKERERLQSEEKITQQKRLENITKAWNTHEQTVNFLLEEACQDSLTRFKYFTNQNLPPSFSGKIKPDFCIEFLGQHCIFDAKKSKNIIPYLRDQAQKTAEKYKDYSEIYPTIFFVIPENPEASSDDDLSHRSVNFSQKIPHSFSHHHLTFIPITPAQIFPTLFLLKKISHYQTLTEFDPRDREALIRLIAHYQRHITFQNATNILLAQKSQNFSEEKSKLPKAFQEDLENYQSHMPQLKLKESEVKALIQKS
jgi:hypothetical protein